MGFDKREVRRCIRHTKNVPAAMVLYIARNGCNGFKCRGCPVGTVCDHRPVNSRDYAAALLLEIKKRYSRWGRIKAFFKRIKERLFRKARSCQ